MLEKHRIKPSLHRAQKENLKVLMENSRCSWLVDANVRVENEKLLLEATNGQQCINAKIVEILRYSF